MPDNSAQDPRDDSDDFTDEDLAAIDDAIREVRAEQQRDPAGSARRLRESLAEHGLSEEEIRRLIGPEPSAG